MRPVRVSALFRLLRFPQWIKNLFVAAPLFFNVDLWLREPAADVALGVFVFCLLSSAVYILNDLLDRETDRLHARKRLRPLASGQISFRQALGLGVLLAASGAGLALLLPVGFQAMALAYAGLQVVYCLWIKHHAILDVMAIALGFVLRVLAGAAILDVTPTPWIVIMTILLALFQALAKRRDDLVREMGAAHRRSLDGYTLPFIDGAVYVLLGGLLVAYLIFTTDPGVIARYGTDKLYYTTPFVIAGILRYLQIMVVEQKSGSPTEIILRDRFMILAMAGWAVSFIGVTHVG